ncbi:hypothetical protein BSKO_10291 [Bryopsis sp. KO-2023]|nr:hypothetical protein BSKO_10291 [Bryopsis sp. KO-2023]
MGTVWSVFFFCTLSLLLSFVRSDNICRSPCIDKLYKRSCGGARCVIGFSTQAEVLGLCSRKCSRAINGGDLLKCLEADFPDRPDVSLIQNTFSKLIGSLCLSRQLHGFSPAPKTVKPATSPKKPVKTVDDSRDAPEEESEAPGPIAEGPSALLEEELFDEDFEAKNRRMML